MATSINPAAIDTPMQPDFLQLWSSMVIRPEWEMKVKANANAISVHQHIYEAFVQGFNAAMPWQFVGVIHLMEASCSFTCHLHNGDSLNKRTVHEPKGRPLLPPLAGAGKPYAWHESARDALHMQGFDKLHLWDITHILSRLEAYNGIGYRRHGIYTPYLWASSNHYLQGKYTSDGKFDIQAVSKQVGAAPILKTLMDINDLA